MKQDKIMGKNKILFGATGAKNVVLSRVGGKTSPCSTSVTAFLEVSKVVQETGDHQPNFG